MDWTVMSYNVQHFNEYRQERINYPLFARVIRESGADVIGINECYGPGSSFAAQAQVAEIAQALGYHWYFAPAAMIEEEGIFGNGILSRFPILEARSVPIPDPSPRGYDGYYETRCVLRCAVEAAGERLEFAVTHFGLNPDEQENAVRTLTGCLPQTRCVLMGDFNVLPDAPVLVPIRSRLVDTAPLLGEDCLTFPSDRPDRKIDYILLSADLEALSAEILPVTAADHRPYRARIRIR